jgi:branched-chain amino acid aminotransferase
MATHGKKLWKDGEIADRERAGMVSVLSHTLHYGSGVFEGIRSYRRARGETIVFRLREHVARLFDSARLLRLAPRVTREDVEHGCLAVVRENEMTDAYLRPLVMRGEGEMGLVPRTSAVETYVMGWSFDAGDRERLLRDGLRCKVSSFARSPVGTALVRGKITGHYVTSTLALEEAKLAGYDEALLLDAQGHVSEGSGANVFLVKNERLSTPPLSSAILAGITRETVLELAREEGLVVREEPLTRDAFYLADEVFLTGTAIEVMPIREIDDRTIGSGKSGEITKILQERYFDVVRGKDDSHPEWLTRV